MVLLDTGHFIVNSDAAISQVKDAYGIGIVICETANEVSRVEFFPN